MAAGSRAVRGAGRRICFGPESRKTSVVIVSYAGPEILVFSSVNMEYVRRMPTLLPYPTRAVYSLREDEYRRLSGGSRWSRLKLRAIMYLAYPARVAWAAAFAPKSSILIVSSNTFFAAFVAWVASRFRRPTLVHWICDVFPDALVVAGAIPQGGLIEFGIGSVQRMMTRTSTGIVYVGELLRQHAERRWGRSPRAFYIDNVPTDEGLFQPPRAVMGKKLVLHYGGQLGLMHEPESLARCVDAAIARWRSEVTFDFRLSGIHRERFARAIASTGIECHGPMPPEQWRELIRDFHVGLVSLSVGGATVSLPSKIYAMMAAGLAIVAICPAWSDVGQIVQRHRCGWVINNSPFDSLADVERGNYVANTAATVPAEEVAVRFCTLLERLLANPGEVARARHNSRCASAETFSTLALRRRWAEALRTCVT
jgi:hypothetical protein